MANVVRQTYNNGVLVSTDTVVEPDEYAVARSIQASAKAALTANANFLALASPTNAQVLLQVERLTKECSGIIRLLLQELDTTDGTS